MRTLFTSRALLWLGVVLAPACALSPAALESLRQEVRRAEEAFAATMARRDHPAFVSFLSAEATFFAADRVLRGRDAVAAHWKRYYSGPSAPFSWAPDAVEVLPSGKLAWSSGPVRDGAGKLIARFNSVWRREGGAWRIVFDKGAPVCPSP